MARQLRNRDTLLSRSPCHIGSNFGLLWQRNEGLRPRLAHVPLIFPLTHVLLEKEVRAGRRAVYAGGTAFAISQLNQDAFAVAVPPATPAANVERPTRLAA